MTINCLISRSRRKKVIYQEKIFIVFLREPESIRAFCQIHFFKKKNQSADSTSGKGVLARRKKTDKNSCGKLTHDECIRTFLATI